MLDWIIPFIVESGSYDTEGGSDGMGGGNWNVTAELEAGGVTGGGTINFDQEFDLNATDGSGYFYQPTNCTGTGNCDGVGGGSFYSDINNVAPLPVGPGEQLWNIPTPFSAVDYTPTLVPVPAPAAVWLFSSAVVGLTDISYRSRIQ